MPRTVHAAVIFDAAKDAETIYKCMELGAGSLEKCLIEMFSHRSNEQRQMIKSAYKAIYDKDMVKDIKDKLHGDFEDVIVALTIRPDEFDAIEVHKAFKGIGTDEETLIEIICSRTNDENTSMAAAYKRLFKHTLEKSLGKETSGHFNQTLSMLLTGSRKEAWFAFRRTAQVDAEELYQAGEGMSGANKSKFVEILATESDAQLRMIFNEYEKISENTIEDAIRGEFHGDLQDAFLAIVKCARNKHAFFAERLHKAMKGAGTDDPTLIRIVVSRCEKDMVQIKEEYKKEFGHTLEERIDGDCSGHYKKILIALVSDN